MNKDIYESPFSSRYSSKEMLELFSPDKKFKTWRELWIALAEAQRKLGLEITKEQIDELKEHKEVINYEMADVKEREFRHDVMAHVHAYGEQCPKARKIIHLGATSCYVCDNTDIIIMREGLLLLRLKVVNIIRKLSEFAFKYRNIATLGFTHFQPAQPVTVGKRACLWIQDLVIDLEDLDYILFGMELLGSKGTTGTQASFMDLFNNDYEKVKKLDSLVAKKMGFDKLYPIAGQTYTRKQDSRILNLISSVAQSAYKFSGDIRLLQHMKEIEEPFEEKQIGSSAMAYKRNPMRCERISALSRYVIVNALNPAITASTQWLERTLDDSANRRISIPEGFLALDAILNLYLNVVSGLVVYPKVINKNLMAELPFMATEKILLEAVKRGGDRQEIHERIRIHSMEAAKRIKEEGKANDLIERIAKDEIFRMEEKELNNLLDAKNFIGCAAEQVEDFIINRVRPLIEVYEKQGLKEIESNHLEVHL